MHDVEGFTHEEIGAALGIPPVFEDELFQGREKLAKHSQTSEGEWIS